MEDCLIASNPAARIGRFAKSEKPVHQASAMTRDETERFLAAVREVCPEWHPFFLPRPRAGLRKGELIALKWGDIQFGENDEDPNRFLLVQRNFSCGRFTTPKSKKSRRVDLSRQLRRELLDLRDGRPPNAFLKGKASIADELVFPCSAWDETEKAWQHGGGSEPRNRITSPCATCNRRWRRQGFVNSGFTTCATRSAAY